VKNKPALYSIVSGCLWALIGYLIAYSVAPIQSNTAEVGRMYFGGVLAAPFIGLGIGFISRRFRRLGRPGRLAVALADLYLAAWLFLAFAATTAHLFTEFSGAVQSRAFRAFVVDTAMGALLGLTYTGYVLVLWPLSYANHLIVANAWDAANAFQNRNGAS
jgi:hypothetical protein